MQLNQNALWYIVSLKLNKYLQIIIYHLQMLKAKQATKKVVQHKYFHCINIDQ